MTKESQCSRILKLLKSKPFVLNTELNRICFRYGARIHDLRKEGHSILSTYERPGVWSFRLKDSNGQS